MRYQDLTPPITPYLELSIGGHTFNCMDFISEAEIELLGDFKNSASKASIAVYDYQAVEIEKLLLNDRNIKLSFGLVDADGNVYREYFEGFALQFKPVIKPEGAGITINAFLNQFIKINKKDKQRSFKGEISQIVKQIAHENGLNADVDKTNVSGTFRQINQTDYEFIRTVLLPKANSVQNDSPFFFWLDGDTLHFKQIHADAPMYRFVYPYDTSEDITSPILTFSPEYNAIAGFLAGEKVKVKKLDPLKKQYTEEQIENNTMDKRVVLGEKKPQLESEKIRVAAHGNTKIEEVGRWKNMWGSISDYPINATLEVLGNPYIKPFNIAEVIVYLIDQKTKRLNLYHHSGLYLIKKVKHSISPGNFKTEIEMIKNAGLKGKEQAKGIVNKQSLRT